MLKLTEKMRLALLLYAELCLNPIPNTVIFPLHTGNSKKGFGINTITKCLIPRNLWTLEISIKTREPFLASQPPVSGDVPWRFSP